ncbi:S-adenosyl-L-methionine-dependent methyltransferase [Lobosporangium transversale]|uniref:S-adenosyl-L-methionine-dependent methyltransferase n=1 Tax=Lobosporangium transversale TaxID=64571 RepID=A0A1Y2GMC1_9FUNG|nr:S-adenosyl-L-methionine-dependent methyltransferase [Lobosporangium transversale]ORZ14257.1 S-adenosyl-L-methionine-dependent methyltransferase [Lobosporangium transversale]|eukprot:XP_021880735.1 S-adenosyl-L-methionine-dependent methyltransferase [Lobosporangium transversale]
MKGMDAFDLKLQWQHGLSVLMSIPSPLAARLTAIKSTFLKLNSNESTRDPIRFRASFDRGEVQHKGVRSQDIAAGLGNLMSMAFPSWKVDLKDYEVEAVGRWIQEESEEVEFKTDVATTKGRQQNTSSIVKGMRMHVGMALPLKLSSCPYRFRPMWGRTALKIEIAYLLLAMAGPKPGDIVMDFCSGIGTIPIVGSIHYPGSLFVGSEYLQINVDKAAENSRGMQEKVNQKSQTETGLLSNDIIGPVLFIGDARAICWRSETVDLIVSDLPWGQRENSHVYNCKLYPRMLREMIRVLKTNGRALLITGERKLLQRQLDAPFAKSSLQIVNKREVTIGFKVVVFEILRI